MVLQMKSSPNDELTIEFRCKGTNPKFQFELDGVEILPASQTENLVTLALNINHGFHILRLSAVDGIDIDIIDLHLNNVSFGDTKFLIFGTNDSGKFQTTSINQHIKELYIPFINPISQWVAMVSEKIPSRFFSGGLYEEKEVYYPTSITISEKFSKIDQDYFKYNYDFYVIDKEELVSPYYSRTVPYCSAPAHIHYDEQELYAEFMNNLDFLTNLKIEHQKGNYLINVIIPSADPTFDLSKRFLLDRNLFPELYRLHETLNIGDIVHTFVGVLGPGETLSVHKDEQSIIRKFEDSGNRTPSKIRTDIEQYGGCSRLYIPINFKQGNYFKFTDVGLLPVTKGPLVINNYNFSHGLINDTDEWRFAIGIVGTNLK